MISVISPAMFWGPGDLVRGALLLATCLLEGQGSSVKEVVKSSEGLLEIRCREEGGPRHQQMGHAEVSRIESIEKCLQKNIRMLRWRKGISVHHIQYVGPLCKLRKKLRDVGFQLKAMLWVRIREMQRFFCKSDAIVER